MSPSSGWRAGGERCVGREHRGQRLVLHVDERRGVVGGRPAHGGDRHDRFADVPHALGGERKHGARLHALVVEEDAAVRLAEPGDGIAAEHADDAGHAARGVDTDAGEARMGVNAANEGDVDHARQRQVVHVPAAPGEQARVVAAFHARSDAARRRRHGGNLSRLTPADRPPIIGAI